MITTTHGDMDESALVKSEGLIDNDNERTTWVEYRIGDEIVHRSVHVTLKKQAVFADGEAGAIQG